MQTAAAHVDRLDAGFPPFLDRQDVAVHQHLIVLHQAAERAECQADRDHRHVVLIADVEDQPSLGDGEVQNVRSLGPFAIAAEDPEMTGGGEVGDRLFPIGLDETRQRPRGVVVQDHAAQRHVAVGSLLSMFRLSISPTVPPLIGWIRMTAMTSVSSGKIDQSTHIGVVPA